MRRIWVQLLLLTVLVFLGCTKEKPPENVTLQFALPQTIPVMDPIYASDFGSGEVLGAVYESLYQYNYGKRPYEIESLLAESLPTISNEGKTYTIKIRKGILFHNHAAFAGQTEKNKRELKASDVIFSIKRIADSKNQSPNWWLLEDKIAGLDEWRVMNTVKDQTDYSVPVKGLKATDDYTVVITLKEEWPQITHALAMPFSGIVSQHVVQKLGEDFGKQAIGTGAFQLDSFSEVQVKLSKNPDYRKQTISQLGLSGSQKKQFRYADQELPLAEAIEVNFYSDEEALFNQFISGHSEFYEVDTNKISSVFDKSNTLQKDLKKLGLKVETTSAADFSYIAFNLASKSVPALRKTKVRQAISIAVSAVEKQVISDFYYGFAISAHSPVPPDIKGHPTEYQNPYKSGKLEQAKKLLLEAGHPNGKGIGRIPFDIIDSEINGEMAKIYKDALSEIGIRIIIRANNWESFQKRLNRKQAQMWGLAWAGDYADAENFLQLFYGPNAVPGKANTSNFVDVEFDKKYTRAILMISGPEQAKLYEELAKDIAVKTPVVLGIHRQIVKIVQPNLINYKISRFPVGTFKYLTVARN